MCKRFYKVLPDAPPFTGKFGKMVLSHIHISPRNIILDAEDKICLIDWEQAVPHPVHFERAAFLLQTEFVDFTKRILASIKGI